MGEGKFEEGRLSIGQIKTERLVFSQVNSEEASKIIQI